MTPRHHASLAPKLLATAMRFRHRYDTSIHLFPRYLARVAALVEKPRSVVTWRAQFVADQSLVCRQLALFRGLGFTWLQVMLLHERLHVVNLARTFILLRGPPIAREQNDCRITLCHARVDMIQPLLAIFRILQKVRNESTQLIS